MNITWFPVVTAVESLLRVCTDVVVIVVGVMLIRALSRYSGKNR